MNLFGIGTKPPQPEMGAMFPAVQDLRDATEQLKQAATGINKLVEAANTGRIIITIQVKPEQ